MTTKGRTVSDRQPTDAEIEASIRRTLAEAAKAEAEAEEAKARRDTELLTQKHTRLLIQHSGIESKVAQIALDKLQREERYSRTGDLYHHRYSFDDLVTDRSVKQAMTTLNAWHRDEPGCDIDFYLNTDGGDITAGLGLIDFISSLRKDGHKVRTIVLGRAASMGAAILQAGTERIMGPNAILLIHEGSLGAVGSVGEVEDTMALMTLLTGRIFALMAERASVLNPKTTAAFLKRQAKRKDWWLDSDQALELGLVDAVL